MEARALRSLMGNVLATEPVVERVQQTIDQIRSKVEARIFSFFVN
jgi:hypothetical protein